MKDAAVKAVPGVSDEMRGEIALQLQQRNRFIDMPTMRAIVDAALSAALPLASVEQGGKPSVFESTGLSETTRAALREIDAAQRAAAVSLATNPPIVGAVEQGDWLVPEFHGVAARKLNSLLADGWSINGYAIQKGEGRRGFVDFGGFVGWWSPEYYSGHTAEAHAEQGGRSSAVADTAALNALRTALFAIAAGCHRAKWSYEELPAPVGTPSVFDFLHKLGDQARDAALSHPEAVRKRHFEILCEALAEVKATSDGESDQPIADIIAGCIAEIDALPILSPSGNDLRAVKPNIPEPYRNSKPDEAWNAALKARVSELEGALARTRSSLQTELDRGVITDTLWMNDVMSETIFDALDSALSRTKPLPSKQEKRDDR